MTWTFLALLGYANIKAVGKMLNKLTPGINFMIAFFVRKFVQSQTLSREKLFKRHKYKKCARKMLMKLTRGVTVMWCNLVAKAFFIVIFVRLLLLLLLLLLSFGCFCFDDCALQSVKAWFCLLWQKKCVAMHDGRCTPGVNFTNTLRVAFSYKSVCVSFTCL